MNRAAVAIVVSFACVACAGDVDASGFDARGGEVVVTVLEGGFVRTAAGRQPLEAAVLDLRQRLRAMPREQVLRFVVRLLAEPQVPDSPAEQRARADLERLFDELEILGVTQIRLL
jgi:hypothetical protein